MKFSTALTSLVLIIPLFAGETFAAAAFGKGGKGGNQGGNKGANNNNKGASQSTSSAAAGSTSAASNSSVLANTGAGNDTGANNNGGGNPQTSLTLDPAVIAPGFAQNGQENATAGQVASLTSTNNYINFCALSLPGVPITNGQQIKTGSCNPAPMGIIAATTNMPSAKFVSPVNGQDLQPNTPFNISLAINNLETGHFTNAESTYYSAPQQVNSAGTIIGHSHITITDVGSFTSTTPQDPNTFAFFKGIDAPAVDGISTVEVTAGLPAGVYRMCSINTDANHVPCLVAIAQHGSLDDCVYYSVGGADNSPFGGAGAGASNSSAAGAAGQNDAGAASNATSSAPPASSSAAAGKGAGQSGNNNGGNKGAGKGGRKSGGRRFRLSDRQSRLGRDY